MFIKGNHFSRQLYYSTVYTPHIVVFTALTYTNIRISSLTRRIAEEAIYADVAQVARRVVVAVLADPVPKRLIVGAAVGMFVTRTLCANRKLFELGVGLQLIVVHRFLWQLIQTY